MCVYRDVPIHEHSRLFAILAALSHDEVHISVDVKAHDHLIKGFGKANRLKIVA